jgi:predicted transposase/invertase (TIGR01784 family)
VDWSSLRLEPGSFGDSQFRRHESDLLFSAPFAGSKALIYCLFEHQTREEPTIALRLLRYMVRIWETQLTKEPGKPLPVILPVVLAQSDRAWTTPPAFSALFDVPEALADDARPFLPDFLFRLVELAEIPFDAIRGTPAGIMVLRVMKAERAHALLDKAVWDEAMMSRVPLNILEMLFLFMLNADVDTDAIEDNVNQIQTPQLKRTAMTLAQKLRQEGRQEGLQKGLLQAAQNHIVEALEVRFGEVPQGLQEAIHALNDEEHLHGLHRTAIQCPSIEAFAEAL